MTPKKIALTIAGGVSLGAYEAGVITELTHALTSLNRRPGHRPYELDVITGGSAGGMTGVLLARILLYDLPGRRRSLHDAWVEEISIERLLDGAPDNALLSKAAVQEIARRHVAEGPFEVVAPASFAPRRLRLSLTLSNLSGIDYSVPFAAPIAGGQPDESFVSTFFSDVLRTTIERDALPDVAGWTSLVDSAVACGNFPLAFQPQGLARRPADYPGADPTDMLPGLMAFIDGGLFDNEPLGEAIDHARQADGGRIDRDRLFIMVDPRVGRSKQRLVDPKAPLAHHIARIAQVIMAEGQAREWLRALHTNRELARRDRLVAALTDLVAVAPEATLTQLLNEVDRQAESIAADATLEAATSPGQAAAASVTANGSGIGLAPSLARVRDRNRHSFETLGGSRSDGGEPQLRGRLLERLLFIVDTVAGLAEKDPIRPVLIGSDPAKTAGDQLEGFGGFFDREWREHDYRQGRIEARRILPAVLGEYAPEEGVEDYTIPDRWRALPEVTIEHADEELRRRLKERATDRTMALLGDRIPWAFRWPVRRFVVGRMLGELLKV